MNKEKLLQDLKQVPEMNPDEHDGSYELMREIVASYSTLNDLSVCDYRDLNAIYMMAVGTWKLNPEKKKEYIKNGNLSEFEKERMIKVIDRIWDNACNNMYENRKGKKPSVGMFGTGFYSFQNKTTAQCVCDFIKMLVDIRNMQDDLQMYDRAALVLTSEFKGMKAASASVVLHCLKPKAFPVLNGNMGKGNIFEVLGVELTKPAELETYISNCRKIKMFRDANLLFKNYRILDQWVNKLDKYQDDDYFPSLDEYDPGITQELYEELLQNEDIFKVSSLDTLYYIYKMGGEASCLAVSEIFGNTSTHYRSNAINVAKKIYDETGCQLNNSEDGTGSQYWAVLFQGRNTNDDEPGTFIWHLRKPLADAIFTLDEAEYFKELNMVENNKFNKNTILYGPPGTGKTYNTVLYAVAIIEEKTLDEISKEAKENYQSVKNRYDTYKASGNISFTTFHQSYGYEEFIEGIRPVINNNRPDESDSVISYEICDGIFKEFCDRASIPVVKNYENDFGLNHNPVIWKVSLEGAGDNDTRRECFEKDHIRIGWDEYGSEINENTVYNNGGEKILDYFINEMRIGDVVLSCYNKSETDGIGVIVGDYEWVEEYSHYRRVRKVRWLVKNIRENILRINGGSNMTLSSVYKLKISMGDVMDIVKKYMPMDVIEPPKNCVFIIDEINRGNISKIFGELITLIENTKRLGMPEETKAILPYSGKEFGVPTNVYILGTMNTADRSIALMDTALRRRFSFVEMMPNTDILREKGIGEIVVEGQTLDVACMLDIINQRIEFLYDREHTIGHAFFTELTKEPTIDKLAEIFEKSVIPLLQEYFYEDYGKIQLILGDDGKRNEDKKYQFICDVDVKVNDLFNTNPNMESSKKYKIQKDAFHMIESYKMIGRGI